MLSYEISRCTLSLAEQKQVWSRWIYSNLLLLHYLCISWFPLQTHLLCFNFEIILFDHLVLKFWLSTKSVRRMNITQGSLKNNTCDSSKFMHICFYQHPIPSSKEKVCWHEKNDIESSHIHTSCSSTIQSFYD